MRSVHLGIGVRWDSAAEDARRGPTRQRRAPMHGVLGFESRVETIVPPDEGADAVVAAAWGARARIVCTGERVAPGVQAGRRLVIFPWRASAAGMLVVAISR